ncbi:MAG: DUF523 domain-containing protein [Christensenella sp.]
MILVSACLAGRKCRYDGSAKTVGAIARAVREGEVLCACPEMMAGMKIPRVAAEIRGGDGFDVLRGAAEVYNKEGVCVTAEFVLGAQRFLQFVKKRKITEVWLKAKSPSCGMSKIYDGAFEGALKDGCGVTCALLMKNGIKIVEIP